MIDRYSRQTLFPGIGEEGQKKLGNSSVAIIGCGAAIATSSMVTEMVKGKSIGEALEISNRAVAEALDGLPPIKMHCSVLAEEALKSAIEDYLAKNCKKKNNVSV